MTLNIILSVVSSTAQLMKQTWSILHPNICVMNYCHGQLKFE